MLQREEPEDFVVATGKAYSVREFLTETFSSLDLDWEKYVEQDERYLRPAEVDLLLGDASKAKKKLKWQPETDFKTLVSLMVENDMKIARREKAVEALD
jgi:GDPmannose 4,6-dehydratase